MADIEKKEKPLEKMTVKELREIALEIPDITGVHAMKKEELISRIKEAKGIKDEKKKKSNLTIKEMKKDVLRLRELKEEARKNKDKRMVKIYQRKINRLKKRMRKAA